MADEQNGLTGKFWPHPEDPSSLQTAVGRPHSQGVSRAPRAHRDHWAYWGPIADLGRSVTNARRVFEISQGVGHSSTDRR